MNPLNSKQLARLREAVRICRQRMAPFLANRVHRIEQFVGSNYSGDASKRSVPTNWLELAISIYLQHLAAQSPRVLFTSEHKMLKPRAADLTLATDHLINEINLADTLQRAVLEAFFAWGIIKVGVNPSGSVEVNGFLHDVTQPFADCVSLDNFVWDLNAKHIEKCQFLGDDYELPLEWAKENDSFDKDVRETLSPSRRREQEDAGEKKAKDISGGDEDRESYRDMVSVWDIWLPMEGLIVTMPKAGGDKPLRVVEWDGPERGPYHFLGFQNVPDNVHPLPPTALWVDLHELSNSLFRKIGRQAERQKTITAFQGAAKADAKNILDAEDGETVQVDNPQGVAEHRFGGPDQTSLAFFMTMKPLISYFSGNLDVLGGLSSQSPTLGQDQLLSASAGNRIDAYRAKVEKFAGGVIFDLAKWLYYDPLIELPLVKRVPGTNIEIPIKYTPEERQEADFLEYNFKVIPYSMQNMSPAARMAALQGVLNTMVAPYIEMMAQQGISINFEALVKKAGRYANIPEELDDIFIFSTPQEGGPGVVGRDPRAHSPAVTQRTQVRVGKPGMSPANADLSMAQQLLSSGGPGPALAGGQ